MALDVFPAIAPDDHADHMSRDAIVGSDQSVGTTWIGTYCPYLFGIELVPTPTTFVEVLLFACRPTAIAWAVAFVVVATLKRQFRVWPFAHIGEEIREFMPALTDRNAASTVVFECYVAWIVAAAKHTMPDKIFRSLRGSHPSLVVGK